MTRGFQRLAIVVAVVAWYLAVRTLIYDAAVGAAHYPGRFEFWWSFFMAIPVTMLSIIFIVVVFCVGEWVFRGFLK
jgi:hypothetical protein